METKLHEKHNVLLQKTTKSSKPPTSDRVKTIKPM